MRILYIRNYCSANEDLALLQLVSYSFETVSKDNSFLFKHFFRFSHNKCVYTVICKIFMLKIFV